MKSIKKLLSIALLLTSSMLARETIKAGKIIAKKICVDELSVNKGCKACRTITSKDFLDCETNTLSKTFLITEPGKYCLGESVTFEPVEVGQPAIQIQSNDVILELCDNILSQKRDTENPENDTADAIGIRIGEEFSFTNVYKNITVKNGTIIGFTGQGVGALNIAIFFGPSAFESITISDLNVYECGTSPAFFYASGIDFDSAGNPEIFRPEVNTAFKNITIERCKVERCLGSGNINIYTGDNVVITDTLANELTDSLLSINVFSYELYCRNLQMFNCQGNNTRSEDPVTGGQVGPALFNSCINAYVKNCQFNNTVAESAGQLMTNISNCQDSIFENCQFNNVIGGTNTSLIAGVHLSLFDFRTEENKIDQGNGLKFINCQFNRIKRISDIDSPDFTAGFYGSTLRNITFEGCEAVDISSEGEGEVDCYGFHTVTLLRQVTPAAGNIRNINYSNCITRDITSNRNAAGFFVGGITTSEPGNPALGRGQTSNMVFDNCIAERIRSTSPTAKAAGIHEGIIFDQALPNPALVNLFVRNSRVSDVRSNVGGKPSALSAGILVESVLNPVLCDNSVSDCDRGIQLTGSNQIIPNAFQLAKTEADALASVPIYIDLEAPFLVSATLTDGSELGPYKAFLAAYSPEFTEGITAPGGLAEPMDQEPQILACAPLDNPPVDFTGKIGICRRGACGFIFKTTNVEAAGDGNTAATLIVSTGDAFNATGPATEEKPTVMINNADGNELIDAILNNPEVIVTIDTIPTASSVQQFSNQRTDNELKVLPIQVNSETNFIEPTKDLTELGWQLGDPLEYTAQDPESPLLGLESGTTYYAIVYSPGFSEDGLIQNNKVDNCSIAGYQDDRQPTSSGWFNNTAFKNSENYDINWGPEQEAKVDEATFPNYPGSTNKYFNLSIKK